MKRTLRGMARILICVLLGISSLMAAPLPLKQAVELALTHSTTASAAEADRNQAAAAYLETKNQYLPQVIAGSGLGGSWGFPLSLEGAPPSLFNVTSQSALVNPALRDFERAAKEQANAAILQAQDQREQVIQDTVVTYTELAKWEAMVGELRENMADAEKTKAVIVERIHAGVDTQVDDEKAQLSIARTRLRMAQAEGAMDVLREHLASLTALDAASIQTVPESIPALPKVTTNDEGIQQQALDSSSTLKAAQIRARAQYLKAEGEHRSLWPSIDFAAQYAVLSRFNNYDQFYKTFERNNASVGVAIRFPFLNPSQHARAQEADAAAVRAKRDAEAAKNQISEQTLKLRRSVEQLAAAQEVASLEYQLAQSNLKTVQIRMDSTNANIHDLEDARGETSERYYALQDADFQLERARIALLRATGELQSWLGLPKQP